MNNKICPLCQQTNRCAIDDQAHGSEKKACWCFAVNIPHALSDMAKQHGSTSQCICRDCIEAYHADPENTLNRIKQGLLKNP